MNDRERASAPEKFIEGQDYYFDNGLMVLTEHYLKKRGYCCSNGCRHCPYDEIARLENLYSRKSSSSSSGSK